MMNDGYLTTGIDAWMEWCARHEPRWHQLTATEQVALARYARDGAGISDSLDALTWQDNPLQWEVDLWELAPHPEPDRATEAQKLSFELPDALRMYCDWLWRWRQALDRLHLAVSEADASPAAIRTLQCEGAQWTRCLALTARALCRALVPRGTWLAQELALDDYPHAAALSALLKVSQDDD
jgi:hypothetical protein